jgi:hypothetical protein
MKISSTVRGGKGFGIKDRHGVKRDSGCWCFIYICLGAMWQWQITSVWSIPLVLWRTFCLVSAICRWEIRSAS